MYLVDSGVWIGGFNPKDVYYPKAKPILRAITEGKLGKILITNCIFNEIVTYLRRKVGSRLSIEVARALLDSEHVKIEHVDERIFNAAYHVFERYSELSFTDAVTVVTMLDRGVKRIFSFDSGFDRVKGIERLESIP